MNDAPNLAFSNFAEEWQSWKIVNIEWHRIESIQSFNGNFGMRSIEFFQWQFLSECAGLPWRRQSCAGWQRWFFLMYWFVAKVEAAAWQDVARAKFPHTSHLHWRDFRKRNSKLDMQWIPKSSFAILNHFQVKRLKVKSRQLSHTCFSGQETWENSFKIHCFACWLGKSNRAFR